MRVQFLKPDGFAIGLFVVGIVMVFLPMMLMPGLIAMIASFGYWLTMVIVRAVHRRRY